MLSGWRLKRKTTHTLSFGGVHCLPSVVHAHRDAEVRKYAAQVQELKKQQLTYEKKLKDAADVIEGVAWQLMK